MRRKLHDKTEYLTFEQLNIIPFGYKNIVKIFDEIICTFPNLLPQKPPN
jgi:hypothetical protein